MRLILLENILSLGKKGEIKEVIDSYAMNYLLPQKKALLATAVNLAKLQAEQVSPQERNESYQKIYKILANQHLIFNRKVSAKGHLFQAVGPKDVVNIVAANYNISIKPKWFRSQVHFKSLGEYKVEINIPDQPVLSLSVSIKKA